jgi:hypothetical protein
LEKFKPYNALVWIHTIDTHKFTASQTRTPHTPPPLPAGPCDYAANRCCYTGCTGTAEQWVSFPKRHRRLCSICANGALTQRLGPPPDLDPALVSVSNPWLYIPGTMQSTAVTHYLQSNPLLKPPAKPTWAWQQ